MNNRRLVRVQVIERVEQVICPGRNFRRREWMSAAREQFAEV
jgi:hypothetical protein